MLSRDDRPFWQVLRAIGLTNAATSAVGTAYPVVTTMARGDIFIFDMMWRGEEGEKES
jgi:hypothetical protein